MSSINHQNNFATNLTSGTSAGATTSPVNSVPSVAAPFYIAFDATNINGHYEVKQITSKTATNILHSATSFDHTTAEEVRMVVPADEMDALWDGLSGWLPYTSVTPTTGTFDSPSFPIVFAGVDLTSLISVGMRVKITQSTVKYFIVTAISFSTDTTITLYGGTDYSLVASGTTAISAFSYSSMKAPVGFPLDPTKWSVTVSDSTVRSQGTPAQNTWYNLGSVSISVPIGAWKLGYSVQFQISESTAGDYICLTTLSTANNSESDSGFSCGGSFPIRGASASCGHFHFKEKEVVVASKTSYYLNSATKETLVDVIYNRNDQVPCRIKAVCAYL